MAIAPTSDASALFADKKAIQRLVDEQNTEIGFVPTQRQRPRRRGR